MGGTNALGVWGAAVGNFSVGDPNYFPSTGGLSATYCDSNPVQAIGIQVVAGIAFLQKGNRLALAAWCVNPNGEKGQWVLPPKGNDNNYFPSTGGLSSIYADTNPVFVPSGQVLRGFQFYELGNRVALTIYVSEPDGGNAKWVKGPQGANPNYFPAEGGLSTIYADTNPVVLVNGGSVAGVGLWQCGNRVAPYIVCGTKGSFPAWPA